MQTPSEKETKRTERKKRSAPKYEKQDEKKMVRTSDKENKNHVLPI
jgi:hypothetical protein